MTDSPDDGYFPPDSDEPIVDDAESSVLVMLNSAVETLGLLCAAPAPNVDLAGHVRHLLAVQQARRDLADVEQSIKNNVGHLMGSHRTVVVDGLGVIKRSVRKNRTKWNTDDLRRMVLDTKLVDPDTGEVFEETPVEKILAVWNLGAPRLTELRVRGIDSDEFCEVEQRPGFDIRIEAG